MIRDELHWDHTKPRLVARRALACALGGLLLLAACGGDDRPPLSAANDPANPEAPQAPLRPAPTTLLGDLPSPAPTGAPDPHHHHHHGPEKPDKEKMEQR